jgi:opacity protein-like surface antigen
MKKLLASMVVLASPLLISGAALADTKNFQGLSAGLNLNLVQGGAKLEYDGLTVDGFGGKQSQSAAIDIAYGIPFGAEGVLTVGIDADLSDTKIFSTTDPDLDINIKQKNRYGIYFAPGIAITKDALIYGKLGYSKMKGELSSSDGTGSLNFGGVSYGVGTRIMISKTSFFKVEASRYTFGSETTDDASIKPSATVGTIGIGFKF